MPKMQRPIPFLFLTVGLVGAALLSTSTVRGEDQVAPFPTFKTHEIESGIGIGRMVRTVDLDGDSDLDILALTDDQILWYENPSWQKHKISGPIGGVFICFAPQDVDGDGLPEIAVGAGWDINNTKTGGSLWILFRKPGTEQGWMAKKIAQEPTLHRLLWADLDGKGQKGLVAVPLKGMNSTPPFFREPSIRLLRFMPPAKPFEEDWTEEVIDDGRLQIAHGIAAVDWEKDGQESLLVAALSGINQFHLDPEKGWKWTVPTVGNPVPFPRCGAGEISVGSYSEKEPVLGTIEPWHGDQAVVYILNRDVERQVGRQNLWDRHVVDVGFSGGHAIGWGDFDGDGQDEFVAGFREPSGPDKAFGLTLFDLTIARPEEGKAAVFSSLKIVLDKEVATEGLDVGDLNGDGRLDIVAIGRTTQNLRYYENLGQ